MRKAAFDKVVSSHARQCGGAIRDSVAAMLAEHGDEMTAEADEAVTVELAVMLAALEPCCACGWTCLRSFAARHCCGVPGRPDGKYAQQFDPN